MNLIERVSIATFNRITPHHFFLWTGLLFGTAFLLITPPFQVPDEINHFYRAWHISTGNPVALKVDNRVGGSVPESIVEIAKPFSGLRWNPEAKTTLSVIKDGLGIPLHKDRLMFVDFPNTGLYSPVSYLPQAFIIYTLTKLDCHPLFIFYCVRLFVFLLWLCSMFFVLRSLRKFRWFFTFLFLLPMSLFINMSGSADVVTNIISMALIALFLKYIFSDIKLARGPYIAILILTFLLASAKLVYVPIVLLFVLVPSSSFQNQTMRHIQLACVVAIAAGTLIFWSAMIQGLYTPYDSYNPQHRVDIGLRAEGNMPGQIEYIKHHIPATVIVFLHSFLKDISMWGPGYIGTFGWLDANLPVWLIVVSWILLFTVLLSEDNQLTRISSFQRKVFMLCFALSTGLLLLSQYLTWDGPGAQLIGTLQGRYFIPVFPLVFLACYHRRFQRQKLAKNIVMPFCLFLLVFSSLVLYQRYYV